MNVFGVHCNRTSELLELAAEAVDIAVGNAERVQQVVVQYLLGGVELEV